MPEYLSPGVYVEEVPAGPRPIQGVGTSTAGFVGLTERGPTTPKFVTNWGDFVRWFGDTIDVTQSYMPFGVRGFFENGGQRAFIARVTGTNAIGGSRNLLTSAGGGNELRISAVGVGAWGGRVMVRVRDATQADPAALPPRDWFRITLLYYRDSIPDPFVDPTINANLSNPQRREPDVFEDYDNLTFEAGRSNNVISVLSRSSQLVEAEFVGTPARPLTINFEESTRFVNLITTNVDTFLRVQSVGISNLTVDVANGTDADTFQIVINQDGNSVETYDNIPDGDAAQALTQINGTSTRVSLSWVEVNPPTAITASRPNNIATTPVDSVEIIRFVNLITTNADTFLRVQSVGISNLTVDVANGTDADTFQIVINQDGNPVETYDNISNGDAEQALTQINGTSTRVSLSWVEVNPPTAITESRPNNIATTAVDSVESTNTTLQSATDGSQVTPTDFAGDPADDPNDRAGLAGLALIDEISLLIAPDHVNTQIANFFQITTELINQCEILRDRFAILSSDAGSGDVQTINPPRDSSYGAVYYPWIRVFDARAQDNLLVPPSGHVAGIYARTDVQRGVHKAPANEIVRGMIYRDINGSRRPLEFTLNKGGQDILNPRGVNVIRDFRADRRSIRVWGARTMSSDPLWRYINVRRLFLFVEESIDEGTQWVVFEPNDSSTHARVRQVVSNFLITVWRSGALQGSTEEQAFFVRCGPDTMTQADIDAGRLICEVGIAPVKPAEFVIFRIQQKTVELAA